MIGRLGRIWGRRHDLHAQVADLQHQIETLRRATDANMVLLGTCRSLRRCVHRLHQLAEDNGLGTEAEAIIADARSSLGELTAYEPEPPR